MPVKGGNEEREGTNGGSDTERKLSGNGGFMKNEAPRGKRPSEDQR